MIFIKLILTYVRYIYPHSTFRWLDEERHEKERRMDGW